jgi:hypothetical protein
MLKNIVRFAALALALAMVGNAASFELPVPDCLVCNGGGN